MKIASPLTCALMALFCLPDAGATTYFYVLPYKDRSQNPFWQGVLDGTMYLEDFEDRSLNTPNVTGSGGGIYQTKDFPNVDGDDGSLDGRQYGFTWTSYAGDGGGEVIKCGLTLVPMHWVNYQNMLEPVFLELVRICRR